METAEIDHDDDFASGAMATSPEGDIGPIPEPAYKPPTPPKKKPPPRAAAQPSSTAVVRRDMDGEDAVAIRDFLDEIVASEAAIRVNIVRKSPRLGPRGEVISGSLETVDGAIDEDYIRETWGGGEFAIKVSIPQGRNGAFSYFKGRTIKIAGEPKMNGRLVGPSSNGNAAAPISADSDPMVGRAFEKMGEIAESERLERRQLERDKLDLMMQGNRNQGIDPTMMQLINGQLEAANQRVASLETTIREMANRPAPTDHFRDRILERAIDGEGKEIAKLREQYEARIDRLRENHDDQLKRLEDRHERDVKTLEARHERELHAVTRATELGGASLKEASGARLDAAKESISRLERELTAMQTELATLRGQKNQTISEKADELLKVQEALEGIAGGKDGDDEPWYSKLIDGVGNSQAALAFINKLGGGPPANQPQQQQMQLPPPGIPFQTGDGNIYVRDAAGNTSIINQQQLRQHRKAAEVRQQRAANKKPAAPSQDVVDAAMEADDGDDDGDDGDDEVAGRPPSATEMKIAVNFIENALKANAPVEQFGQTARNLIPSEILVYLQHVGFEKFLAGARLDTGSPLATVRGRQFLRSVVKFLQEGTVDAAEPAAG